MLARRFSNHCRLTGCTTKRRRGMSEVPTTTRVQQQELISQLADLAGQFQVPGVAVGIYHQGEEQYAVNGVTSIENPVPVDENTLFQFGSTGKTFTATAIMRLVEQGKIDLDVPVRTYRSEEHTSELQSRQYLVCRLRLE